MNKYPKSIVVSYRISPAIIAKAIDGLKIYDKTADIRMISSICKQTFLHGVNYLTHTLPFEPSQESREIVQNLTIQGKRREKRDIEREILISGRADFLSLGKSMHEEVETKSEKKIITDWSITPDMREGEEGE